MWGFSRLVAKEAGDDDLYEMRSVGTTAAHTHHSEEEAKIVLRFGRAKVKESWGRRRKTEVAN